MSSEIDPELSRTVIVSTKLDTRKSQFALPSDVGSGSDSAYWSNNEFKQLSLLLKGETLQDEGINGGAFVGSDGVQIPHKLIPNAGIRCVFMVVHNIIGQWLNFVVVVGGIKCPPITREEIVNACGVEDIHDGTNYSRYAHQASHLVFSRLELIGKIPMNCR
ncbi:ARP2/3 actin-organizing complex subunit Arc5 [Stylosanthes scabra]|uniref:ARP2/3 actin-organizing complex subunit Arc5 n=1 Tax=Stylosanthes scabra TaxID=79078 RepID=A0ABU6W3H5_9FABA|nr:ARP2/3 actin-organizing complex subunit Arc5 [Stylosanthes scabra]